MAPRLARTAANGVCIRGDDIKSFVVARAEPTTVGLGLTYVGAAVLTDVYLAAGYDLVVVDFIFERPDHVRRFTHALTSSAGVLLITLWTRIDVIRWRRAEGGRASLDTNSSWRLNGEAPKRDGLHHRRGRVDRVDSRGGDAGRE